jgi:hypothetical protein
MNSGLTGAQASNQAQMILNRNNLPQDWGPSALNAAEQASLSGSYALPFGRGKHFMRDAHSAANTIVGGWQLNAIVTLLSGFPFTPQIGANRSGDGDTRNPDRPSLNPAFTGPVVLGTAGQWFNPNAFVPPTPGTYGNLGRSVYLGPGLADADISLLKGIAIRENVSLQFRAEFFNLLNHPNFGTPNATVFSGTSFSPSAGLITTPDSVRPQAGVLDARDSIDGSTGRLTGVSMRRPAPSAAFATRCGFAVKTISRRPDSDEGAPDEAGKVALARGVTKARYSRIM